MVSTKMSTLNRTTAAASQAGARRCIAVRATANNRPESQNQVSVCSRNIPIT